MHADCKLDIALVVDCSGSIRDNNPPDGSVDNWKLIIDFMDNVVEGLKVSLTGTHVGAVSFGKHKLRSLFTQRFAITLELA